MGPCFSQGRQHGEMLASSHLLRDHHAVRETTTSMSPLRTQGPITTGLNCVIAIGRVSLLIDHAVWVPAFACVRRDDKTEKCPASSHLLRDHHAVRKTTTSMSPLRTQGPITTGSNCVIAIGRVSLLIDHAVWLPAFARDDETEKCPASSHLLR